MIGFEQLMRMGPGDKMSIAFTKNPKPTWLQGQEAGASEAAAPAPAPAPMPMPPPPAPMGGAGLPPSPMALNLMQRDGQ